MYKLLYLFAPRTKGGLGVGRLAATLVPNPCFRFTGSTCFSSSSSSVIAADAAAAAARCFLGGGDLSVTDEVGMVVKRSAGLPYSVSEAAGGGEGTGEGLLRGPEGQIFVLTILITDLDMKLKNNLLIETIKIFSILKLV